MKFLNFLKKNKNINTENGINYIYYDNGKGLIKEKFNKVNGVLNGDYIKYNLSGGILSKDYYLDGVIITMKEKERINNEKENIRISNYNEKINKLLEIDNLLSDNLDNNLIIQMNNDKLIEVADSIYERFSNYFEKKYIKIYLFYKRNYMINFIINNEQGEFNLSSLFRNHIMSNKRTPINVKPNNENGKKILRNKSRYKSYRSYYKDRYGMSIEIDFFDDLILKLKSLDNNYKSCRYSHKRPITIITELFQESFNLDKEKNNITIQNCILIGLELEGLHIVNEILDELLDELKSKHIQGDLLYSVNLSLSLDNIYKKILSILDKYKCNQDKLIINLDNINFKK